LTAQRPNTPFWKVNTDLRLEKRLKWPNHSPKVLNRSALDLVEAITSQ
jgi:hypothetical protein